MQRRRTGFRSLGLCAALLLASVGIASHAQSPSIEEGVAAELQLLASRAGTIFVGQITLIERKGSIVEVTFRVEQSVAGAPGSTCVLREWAGLWPPGHFRYTVGQRVLAFLHAPSAAGLSSPVHGAEGLVPVIVQGADAPQLLNIRRVAAAVVRNPNTPLPTDEEAGMLLAEAVGLIAPEATGHRVSRVRLPLPSRGKPPVDRPRTGTPGGTVQHALQVAPRVPGPKPVVLRDGSEIQ